MAAFKKKAEIFPNYLLLTLSWVFISQHSAVLCIPCVGIIKYHISNFNKRSNYYMHKIHIKKKNLLPTSYIWNHQKLQRFYNIHRHSVYHIYPNYVRTFCKRSVTSCNMWGQRKRGLKHKTFWNKTNYLYLRISLEFRATIAALDHWACRTAATLKNKKKTISNW